LQDSPILQNDFETLAAYPDMNRAVWFKNALDLVQDFGPGNIEIQSFVNGGGVPSSKMYDITNLAHPFITGAGPSWGCTSVVVYSDRGIWLAHFWEEEQIQDNMNSVIDFLHNGREGNPSLTAAKDMFFRTDDASGVDKAGFVFANIFTPSAVLEGRHVPFIPRNGRGPFDPYYWPQIDTIKENLMQIVPGIGHIQENTYLPYDKSYTLGNPAKAELGIMVVEYVPRHVHQVDQQTCVLARAIRILHPGPGDIPVGMVEGPYAWPWPNNSPPAQPGQQVAPPGPGMVGKRMAVGECPSNIDDLLAAQGTDGRSTNDNFFDTHGYLSGGGSNSAGGTVEPGNTETPAPTPPADPTPPPMSPTDPPADPTPPPMSPTDTPPEAPPTPTPMPDPVPLPAGPFCDHVQGPPSGGSVFLGWGCMGYDSTETISYTLAPQPLMERRLRTTFIA
jgi:hypothetical protein